ncbi:BQ2448_7285 [Microbotryum intermedium]|uniref:BQ2448_7285 protein n=1 Tax=Microbotryum intermedium TaxID=269621 RepID=A0A238FKN5_9BASI|nr:BQ2448_7285 [Microbotryum intermedium]
MHRNKVLLSLFLLGTHIITGTGVLASSSTWPYGSYTPYGDPETPSDSGEASDPGPPPPDRLPLNLTAADQFLDCLNNTGTYYNVTVERDGTILVVPTEPPTEIVLRPGLLRCIRQATGAICVAVGASMDNEQAIQDSVPSYQIDGQWLADHGALSYDPHYWQEQQFRNGPDFDDIAVSPPSAQARTFTQYQSA